MKEKTDATPTKLMLYIREQTKNELRQKGGETKCIVRFISTGHRKTFQISLFSYITVLTYCKHMLNV